jgi:hypothetical protein
MQRVASITGAPFASRPRSAREREAAANVAFDPFQQSQQLALEDLVVVAAAIRKTLDCLGLPSRPPLLAPPHRPRQMLQEVLKTMVK